VNHRKAVNTKKLFSCTGNPRKVINFCLLEKSGNVTQPCFIVRIENNKNISHGEIHVEKLSIFISKISNMGIQKYIVTCFSQMACCRKYVKYRKITSWNDNHAKVIIA
jgi:hypothetical protein